ncbi:MAG TPA: FAD-dependent oxidoreductase [Firmicutes bacterium]|nr:FAD-dependent oxidoreductase [Bacillota bacterium]
MTQKAYDIVVLGGGPAGATASIYGARAGHRVLLLEKMIVGGEIVSTERLENFPGFPEGLSGFEFGQRLEKQVRRFEVKLVREVIEQVSLTGEEKKVFAGGEQYLGRALIIATGTIPRMLNVEGEQELKGKGVSYCADCDAHFFRGKEVAVVAETDAALREAITLAGIAGKVYVINRRDSFQAARALQQRLLSLPNVEVLWKSTVGRLGGGQKLNSLQVIQEGTARILPVEGVFIYSGRQPNAEFLKGEVAVDDQGYILTNEQMETSVAKVYAAGDVRQKQLRQVITAAADGAIAATSASRALRGIS